MIVKLFDNEYDITSETTKGRRNENQDAYSLVIIHGDCIICKSSVRMQIPQSHNDNDRAIFVVCDGMGGMQNGSKASNFVIESVTHWFIEDQSTSIEQSMNSFKKYISSIDLELRKRYPNSGTTIVMVLMMDDRCYSLHLGDSRCYHSISGSIKRTRDHTPVEKMIQCGLIDEDEISENPLKNVISSYIGKGNVDELTITLIDDFDQLMLCSDGTYKVLDNETIGKIMSEYDSKSLTQYCIDKDSDDNITSIIIKKNKNRCL